VQELADEALRPVWNVAAGSAGRIAMTTDQKVAPPRAKHDDEIRARNARALELVREWLADDSDYDLEVFPELKAEIEADRLSYRKRFKE
jgi:hypothetical protein